MASLKQYCTFFVDNMFLAIDVLNVQEVIRCQEMTRVPTAPRVVRGLINLRGQIVTAIDLRQRLDLPEAPPDHRPINVVVRTDDGAVSLLVDEIGDVLELDDHACVAPPETIPPVIRDVLEGIYHLKKRLVLVLGPDRVVNLTLGASLR
jgi:purine-binding chemotaxis protein CheW